MSDGPAVRTKEGAWAVEEPLGDVPALERCQMQLDSPVGALWARRWDQQALRPWYTHTTGWDSEAVV